MPDMGFEMPTLTAIGTYNGKNYYEWIDVPTGNQYTIYFDLTYNWLLVIDGVGGGFIQGKLDIDSDCPDSTDVAWFLSGDFESFISTGVACIVCGRENRYKETFQAVQFPQPFEAQDRGFKDCCCEQLILANGNESWQNDITSYWIKLSKPLDTAKFNLCDENGDVITIFIGTEFPNEPNAFYYTMDWTYVLNTYGPGCYYLTIDYNISGMDGTLVWGLYNVKEYSIENALKTARVRAIFNGVQEIDGINFTASNVESTHRFYGFIGNRQPNMEIDNIIYDNREMKRVIRENLNDYEIITDPSDECIIKPLIDLYLISENELYISDYNAHNHSYRYLDIPVIVQESPDLEYFDFSRKARLKCKVGDKFKNQRTHY